MKELVLASASEVRARLLRDAGIAFEVHPANVDENAIKQSLKAENAKPYEIAETLAELKTMRVSQKFPDKLVLGADQVLDCEGQLFDKPQNIEEARQHLKTFRNRTHELASATCVGLAGSVIWRRIDRPRLTMRAFSDDFIDHYLIAMGDEVLKSVGAYQLESHGAQLFSEISGDFFTILGLPLLPVLDFLRLHEVAQT